MAENTIPDQPSVSTQETDTTEVPAEEDQQDQKPILTVLSFDADEKRYSFSSFVTKLHFRLRHANVPYENGFGSKTQAPKGKIPYVQFRESRELMGDSGLIVQRLVDMGVMEDLNGSLTAEERARDFCLRTMVEDRIYYLTLYERWYDNYNEMRDRGPFASLPSGIRHVVVGLAFRYARLMLYMQGTGRYVADEVARLRDEAIGVLADFAEAARGKRCKDDVRRPFWILGGEKPTEADFTLFGYLSGMLVTVTQPATTALIKGHPSLVDYVERIHQTYFPDFYNLVGDLQGTAG